MSSLSESRLDVLLKDDFRQGLDLTSTWALLSFPPSFIADDGVVSTSRQGLDVKAAGRPADRGAAFTGTPSTPKRKGMT